MSAPLDFLLKPFVLLKAWDARATAAQHKLDTLFQPGRRVRSIDTGRSYDVVNVHLDGAFLRAGPQEDVFIIDLLRTDADRWEAA